MLTDNFMERYRDRIDEEIYKDSLERHEMEDSEGFDETVTFVSVSDKGRESEITYCDEKGEEITIRTDRPGHFWYGMKKKKVHIIGTCITNKEEKMLLIKKASVGVDIDKMVETMSDKELDKYSSIMKGIGEKQKRSLFNTISKISDNEGELVEEESFVKMNSPEELKALYEIVKSYIPVEVRHEIERNFDDIDRGSNTEKNNCKKVLYYLINNDWIGTEQRIDVGLVEKKLNESHIGMEYAKKKLIRELNAVIHSKDKVPGVILLVGEEGCGKTSLAKSFFEAMDIKHVIYNLSGVDNPVILTGTSRVYENGRPSPLLIKCFEVGKNGGIVLDEIDKIHKNCVNALFSFIDKSLMDEFMEVPIDISTRWIICTANDISRIPPALLDRVTVINIDEYSYEEKERIIEEIMLPRMYKQYFPQKECKGFTKEVRHKIIDEFADGKSIRTIEKIIREIFVSALYRKEEILDINMDNIGEYFKWGEEIERIRESYVRDYAAIEKKIRTCSNLYPDSVKKRNEVLLRMALRGNESEKEYALSALRITANILNEELEPVDIERFKKELDESHYGMEKAKKAIGKSIVADMMTEKRVVKAILMDGCPGVGKTSICQTIAKAMGRKFVKISLNGISSSDVIKGFPRTYKNSQAGIIALKLAEADVCSYSAVVLLDEVDKMIANSKDDPYSTLHDLLDNNGGFYEQYLETTIPTENILWILTSNDKNRVPQTILDRVKVIDMDGYSIKEKLVITKDYVIPKLAKRYKLDSIGISEMVLDVLIKDYCISYGIRDVERAVENIIETIALERNMKLGGCVNIEMKDLSKALGARKIGFNDFPENSKSMYGQARALAVAGNYGSTFAVQIVENPYGEEDVEVTGLAKGSFAESIKVARSLVCNKLGRKMPKVHIHALNSGIEKDGPSAGVTLFACMMSFMLKKPLPNVAFTGTIDLFGNIGVIGGEKLKLAAAEKAGVEKVFLPKANYERLLDDGEIDSFAMEIKPVNHVDEIVRELFGYIELDTIGGVII